MGHVQCCLERVERVAKAQAAEARGGGRPRARRKARARRQSGAQRRAQQAEDNAVSAVDFAYLQSWKAEAEFWTPHSHAQKPTSWRRRKPEALRASWVIAGTPDEPRRSATACSRSRSRCSSSRSRYPSPSSTISGAASPHQWPAYLAYATSFITIGGIWLVHHGIFRRLQYANSRGDANQPGAADGGLVPALPDQAPGRGDPRQGRRSAPPSSSTARRCS